MSEDVQKEIFSRNLKAYIANSGKTQLEIAHFEGEEFTEAEMEEIKNFVEFVKNKRK